MRVNIRYINSTRGTSSITLLLNLAKESNDVFDPRYTRQLTADALAKWAKLLVDFDLHQVIFVVY